MLKKCLVFISILFSFQGVAGTESSYCLGFVHIGERLPDYLVDAVAQARLFNPNCKIYVMVNEIVKQKLENSFKDMNISLVTIESTPLTSEHIIFNEKYVDNPQQGFWRFTKERFLYLYDLMHFLNIDTLFHLENDNMLYVNLAEILPVFKQHYPSIGLTLENDGQVVAGFMYIASVQAMKKLASFFAETADKPRNDMQLLAAFRATVEGGSDNLPIIMPEYTKDHVLISSNKRKGKNPEAYCKHIKQFNSLFDAAGIGLYLGGRIKIGKAGFINPNSIFNPEDLEYVWEADVQDRKVPFVLYKNSKYRMNNLHIHSKELSKFKS